MRFRALYSRAILLPLGVAIASVVAVAWYGFIKIPAQQRYITDRNLRLLKTKSAQIKSKVDSFDGSIDNAQDFYPRGSVDEATYAKRLNVYFHSFAPDLEILGSGSDQMTSLRARATDPPRAVIQRDEGRNYLYLAHKYGDLSVVARSDIEQTLAPYLTTGTEFDALLLVARDGRVIAQQSPSGLELAHVDGLRDRTRPAQVTGADGKVTAASNLFESMRASANIANVVIGNAEYQMYIHPVQLSLTAGNAQRDGEAPEEWSLLGFVRADHFRADGSAVSYTYLLWFGGALLTVCFAIPLLKLQLLSPAERLRGSDGVLVAATTFLATGLLTFCVTDAYIFHYEVNEGTRDELNTVAAAIGNRFNAEAAAIARQMEEFERPAWWHETLSYGKKGESFSLKRLGLTRLPPAEVATTVREEEDRYHCRDEWACRDNILVQNRDAFRHYPYFERILCFDDNGWQRIKWSVGRVTPLVNVASVPYYQQLKSSRLPSRAGAAGRDAGLASGVSVVQSANTGAITTVFWRALGPAFEADAHLIGQALLTTPIALTSPVLLPHTEFAVIDNTGRVMFHSDRARALRENFFAECEDDGELRAAVAGRRSEFLNVSYLARSYSLYATPLDLASFGDPGWTLMVFRDRALAETVNLETLAAGTAIFGLYALGLAAVSAIVYWLWPQRVTKWFWPDPSAAAAYRAAMLVNGSLGLLFLAWIAHFDSTALVVSTALLAVTALVSTFLLVTMVTPLRTASAEDPQWRNAFVGARVSFLCATAAIPALACFLVAYNFEMTLVAKSGQTAVAAQFDARDQRIRAWAERLRLCASGIAVESCRSVMSEFIAARAGTGREDAGWDVDVPPPVITDVSHTRPARMTRLDGFLASVHQPYNDVAVELAAVLPSQQRATALIGGHRWRQWLETNDRSKVVLSKAPGSPETITAAVTRAVPTVRLLIVLVGLIGVLYALVCVVQPLYALELQPEPRVRASDPGLNSTEHVLLVGPPGSGKSDRLAKEPRIRVFDARIRAFAERRVRSRPVPVERRRRAFAGIAAVHAPGWTEPIDAPAALQSRTESRSTEPAGWLDASSLPADARVPIGIDHLEYSLESRQDREQMLRFLEELIYRHRRTVWIVTAREPVMQLQELPDDRPDAAEMARWTRVFQSFREEHVGLPDEGSRHSDADAEQIRNLFAPYYRALWAACSKSEQLALRQLAEEGVVNPQNDVVLAQLLRNGLIRRDPTFRLMNEPFRHFVLRALAADEVRAREWTGVSLPWASVMTTMLTVAFGLGAVLVLTSQQLVDDWIGYVPALAPAVPTVLKLLASAQRDGKPVAT